jgi:hypothetical protein
VGVPYRALINERTLLNLPGFHSGAYVYGYVEDTSERGLARTPYCNDGCNCCPQNFEPRMTLEIADCHRHVSLEFDIDTLDGRANSLHKLDTLLAALQVFRAAIELEFEPYDERQQQLDALRAEAQREETQCV